MYTIILNENNQLTVSVRERIMQRSKLVDSLHFLVDPIYKGINMAEFTVMMEYVLPVSREYITEVLVKKEELYKDKLEYILPFDTCLTREAGDIEVQLTFLKVDLDQDGTPIQQVRKTLPATITILPISAWSDIIPDGALTTIDQRLIKTDAQIKALEEFNDMLYYTKADDLAYNKETSELQLTAGGRGIGRIVDLSGLANDELRQELLDGVPVINFSEDDPPVDENGEINNVVEF